MRAIIALSAFLIFGSEANAEQPPRPPADMGRGTSEDEKACGPDARRLCRTHLADDMAVLRCFQANRPKLSRACRAVLQRYGQ